MTNDSVIKAQHIRLAKLTNRQSLAEENIGKKIKAHNIGIKGH